MDLKYVKDKKRKKDIPIIMITARKDDIDKT